MRILTDCLGIRIEHPLPYSPDLNPIEESFLKSNIPFNAIKLTTLQQLEIESYMIYTKLWT
jgi:transposase